ncbi:PKD domain-containing protein [Roseateles sp. DAIF2]|uniref:YCF48-related protein n=1 Tax=Roseateles sp. DAIF2 TaxID=2714952 RepID=UPI0018A27714|nr:YCF48-related protein [Roseateles sp. DAIF2]QPF71665.1 PKD domain-containing protein [Roseateles sp. DAIF2]
MSTNLYERAGWAGVLLSAALLSACGGGGDSADPAPQPTVQPTAIPDNLSITAPASSDVTAGTTFTSNAAALTGLSFAWSFGDGSGSTEASPKHDYAKVGDYEVTLRVSNTAGASKELKYKLSVNNRAHVKGLVCSAAADSGWCWQQPRPTGTSREDYFFLDAQTGWSVGDNGEIFKTVDGGKTWARQDSGLSARLLSIAFADANNGWAVGSYGAVLRSTDGGKTWSQQALGLSDSGLRVRAIDANTAAVYSIYGYGRMRRTTDGGKTWVEQAFAPTEIGTDGTLWSFDGYTLKKSSDGGATSSTLYSGGSYSDRFQLVDSQLLFVRSYSSTWDSANSRYVTKLTLRRSSDAGASWTSYEAQGLVDADLSYSGLGDVSFQDADKGFLVAGANIYRSADGGRSWSKLGTPASGSWSYSSAKIFAGGVLYRKSNDNKDHFLSEDGGGSWLRVASPTSDGMISYSPRRLGAKTWLWVSGDQAYLSNDGMLSWTQVGGVSREVAQRSLEAAWFFDAKRGLALNASGELQETSNGGLDWSTKIKNLVAANYGTSEFQFTANGSKGWLLAGDNRIYRSSDGGASWSTPLMGRYTIGAFHFVDESTGFAKAYDQNANKHVLLASSDGGTTWTQRAELTAEGTALQFGSDKKGVIVGRGGHILATEDGGKTWVARFSGTSVSLNRVLFSDASTAWALGESGTVLKSGDAGQTWTPVNVGATQRLNSIRFIDAQQGWIVGDGGTILLTRDGGRTWVPQNSGTQKSLQRVYAVDSRTAWISGNEGTLLATGTGGL